MKTFLQFLEGKKKRKKRGLKLALTTGGEPVEIETFLKPRRLISLDTYTTYGHSPDDGNFMWVWRDNKLDVLPATTAKIHKDFWEDSYELFRGRYDALKKAITIWPPNRIFRIPGALQKALIDKFDTANIKLADINL